MDKFDSLRICNNCGCRICFESGAEPLTPELWLVVVQCPNCWSAWRVSVTDVELELFERALDEDTRVIEAALDEIEHANAAAEARQLAAEIERFSAALRVDAIVPMDF
jgi:hypothetical protein